MSKTMLVADDSVVIQKSIGITFAQEDYSITYVNNGDDAVAKAKQMKPDIVLADVAMPKKNGYEVCEALRQDPQVAAIPVLLLAGTHEPFDETRGKSSGANGHVIKPFESQALIERVGEIIGGTGAPQAAPAQTGGGNTTSRTCSTASYNDTPGRPTFSGLNHNGTKARCSTHTRARNAITRLYGRRSNAFRARNTDVGLGNTGTIDRI